MIPPGFQSLRRSEDGAASPLRTEIAITADPRRLVARFRCEYHVLVATGEAHDDDLWRGDVVELFIAPDPGDRRTYFEIEVNPAGLVFDARVDSPELDRRTIRVDRSWNPRGLRVVSRVLPPRERALARGRVPERGGSCGPTTPLLRHHSIRRDHPLPGSLHAPQPPAGDGRRRPGSQADDAVSAGGARAGAVDAGAVDAGTAGGRPGLWLVRVALDWREILPAGAAARPVAIGAYRIDRCSMGSTGSLLFLSLFPNLRTPPDFHTPRHFGVWDPRAGILPPVEPGHGT